MVWPWDFFFSLQSEKEITSTLLMASELKVHLPSGDAPCSTWYLVLLLFLGLGRPLLRRAEVGKCVPETERVVVGG